MHSRNMQQKDAVVKAQTADFLVLEQALYHWAIRLGNRKEQKNFSIDFYSLESAWTDERLRIKYSDKIPNSVQQSCQNISCHNICHRATL